MNMHTMNLTYVVCCYVTQYCLARMFLCLYIIVLFIYGIYYYRNFSKARFPRRFPLVFLIIGVSCVSFLWVNIHAPMSLQTFSNLDHHFIRHDGFEVNKKIELGRADTANYDNNSFNRFVFVRKESQVHVNSVYSEEPFYMEAPAGYKILSVNYPAIGHVLSFRCQKAQVTIRTDFENDFELRIGENIYKREVAIKKAINCWNIFREDDEFISSTYFGSEGIVECLKSILLLRDDVTRKKAGDLKYFLSAKLFNNSDHVIYDGKSVNSKDLQFDDDEICWQDHRINIHIIKLLRERNAISFGSCSFLEPIEDLQGLEIL